MPQIALPYSKDTVTTKDFISHGAVVKWQQSMFKDVKADYGSLQPTKDDLIDEFGPEAINELETLDGPAYEKRFKELQGKYIATKMDIQSLGVQNMEEANMQLILAVVTSVKKEDKELWPTDDDKRREFINDLHQKDYQFLIDTISELEGSPLGNQSSNA